MKKKILLPIFALALVGSLAACGGGDQPGSTSSGGGGSSGGSSNPGSSSVTPEPEGSTAVGNYVTASTAEKTEILGKLEKYAIDNLLAGLPLFEDGGYQIYASRVEKGFSNYIQGYGFGTLRYGRLNGSLSGTVASTTKPTYYHTVSSSDPKTANYWDDQGSQVASLLGYMSTSYYGTIANEARDNYEWAPMLATKERPWIVENAGTANETAREASATDSGTTWRIYVRTNDEGAVYRTASTREDRKAYDGRKIALDDYLTPFKIMLTQGIGFYRGGELASNTGKYGIQGAAKYYSLTKNSTNWDDELFAENVGVKTGTDTNGDYIQMTMLAPTTRFYAMYSFSDGLYMPIPASFWNLVTNNGANPGNWFSYNNDKTLSIIDNSICVGPYYLESWEDDKATAFAKNDSWKEYDEGSTTARAGIYNIPGIYISILTALSTDSDAAFKQWLAGEIDACGITTTYLEQYKDNDLTVKVPGSSVWKLNVNSCNEEEWIEKFGENGSITQTAVADYHDVKPWMSNDDFIKGLFYSINRTEFAEKRGFDPSVDYFSGDYMSDPEGGVSYNSTDAHKAAQEDFWGDTLDTYGYDLALSQTFFDSAIETLMADGSIKAGDTLNIDLWWMYQADITEYGNDIVSYFKAAFDGSANAKANNLTLNVKQEAGANWSDVYYKHLMVGQFDLGFGSISGNSLDPLNFMEVLKSNNSGGFTLNWGPDTADVGIDYDGQEWSFDTLWAAADHGIATYKGEEIAPLTVENVSYEVNETTNDLTFVLEYESADAFLNSHASEADVKSIIDSGRFEGNIGTIEFYDDNAAFVDVELEFDVDAGTVTVKDLLDTEWAAPEGVTATWDKANEKVTIEVKSKFFEDAWADVGSAYDYYYEYYYAAYYATYYQSWYQANIKEGMTDAAAKEAALARVVRNAEYQASAIIPTGFYFDVNSHQRIDTLPTDFNIYLGMVDATYWEPVEEGGTSSSAPASARLAH